MKIRWFLLSLLAGALMWGYVSRILGPWEYYVNVGQGRVRAQLGDLYPRWVGTRDLFLYKLNPYSPQVSHEIQVAYYGHTIEQAYVLPKGDIIDEQRFAYPVYVVLLLAPTVHADFATVQKVTPFVLALFTALNVFLCLRIIGWKLPPSTAAALVLFILASPQIVQGLRLRQLGLVAGMLLTACIWCIRANRLASAGTLLAFSTIKPQMVLLPLCCLVIWFAGDWRKRWPMAASLAVTLTALVGAGELLVPGWLRYFFLGLAAYPKYTGFQSVLRLALGDAFATFAAGLIAILLFAFAWRNRKSGADSPQFVLVLSASLAASLVAIPLLPPFNEVLLLLPLMLILRDWKMVSRTGRAILAVAIGWPWIACAALLCFVPRLNSAHKTPLLPSLFVVFVPFVAAVLLFARRDSTIEAGYDFGGKSVPTPVR